MATSVNSKFAELDARIGTLRSEVRKMADVADELTAAMLAMWQRNCPLCGRQLEKVDPMRPLQCPCGWVWE